MNRFGTFAFVLSIHATAVRHRRQFEEFGQILDQGFQDLQNFPNQINDLVNFDNVGEIWNDNFNEVTNIFNNINWMQLENTVLELPWITDVEQAFSTINWNTITNHLFTIEDNVSQHIVDAYRQSRQILRDLTCDSLNFSAQCQNARDLFRYSTAQIDQLQREIDQVLNTNLQDERYARALELDRQLKQIKTYEIPEDVNLNFIASSSRQLYGTIGLSLLIFLFVY